MKKLMMVALCALAANVVMAEVKTTVQIGGLIYWLFTDSKNAHIVGYDTSNPPTKVDVAEVEYDGGKYKVISFEQDLFQGCGWLESFSLPNLERDVLDSAFKGCQNLKEVSFPNFEGEIRRSAFEDCQNLKEVSLPLATTIGEGAFSGCENLKEVSFPNATTIRRQAFRRCENLTSVFSPFVTTIEQTAFSSCFALSNLVVNIAMKAAIEANGTAYYGIPYDTTITYYDGYSYSVLEKAEYQMTMTMKSGDTAIDEDKYKKSCEILGLTPIEKPQVVQEGEVAVKETELQAAKAEAVSIVDGVVSLGVTVNTNGNFTAETKDWKPVELKSENVKVEDGKIVISIPVSDKSGFMILQSGDAKVPNAAVTHEPWYTPIE